MRFNYKVLPLEKPHPAFPKETSVWMPILTVRINNPVTHSPPTKRFDALVDSGAPECYFHGDIARAIGIRVDEGVQGSISGIVQGNPIPVYYHNVGLFVGSDIIRIKAGFSDQISVAAILGRRGFFENFQITFDPAGSPPGLEIQRVGRA